MLYINKTMYNYFSQGECLVNSPAYAGIAGPVEILGKEKDSNV